MKKIPPSLGEGCKGEAMSRTIVLHGGGAEPQ